MKYFGHKNIMQRYALQVMCEVALRVRVAKEIIF